MSLSFALLALLPVARAPQFELESVAKISSSTSPSLGLADGDHFGQSSTPIGDLNGDGFEDLAIGMPYADDGGTNRGAVEILFLDADGDVESVQRISSTSGGFAGPLDDRDLFGWSLAALDVDDDGQSELAVGARSDDDGGFARGAVWILFLGTDGQVQSHQKISSIAGNFTDPLADNDEFGFSLACPGDINGDGRDDLTVGATTSQPSGPLWPGSGSTQIGAFPGFEPSGVVWNPVLERIFVVSDEGRIACTTITGDEVELWILGGDFEGVTFIDPESTLLYIGLETPDSILEFDYATGELTGNTWDLTPWMFGIFSEGLEALTYANGRFYAGHQGEGTIYVFELFPGGVVSFINTIPSPLGLADLSGLHYSESTDTLYAIHDTANRIIEMELDGTLVNSYSLPGEDQEGIVIVPNCPDTGSRVIIAQDSGAMELYDSYPTNCYGPSDLPGVGAIYNLFLRTDATVGISVKIGPSSGGFDGALGAGDHFGAAIAPLGDLDGDMTPDLAVGSPFDDGGGHDRGAIWTLFLNPDGRVKSEARIGSGVGGLSTELADDDQFGWSLAAAGDVDGDGAPELAVGIPGADGAGNSLGAVELVSLSTIGLAQGSQRFDASSAALAGNIDNFDQFGASLSGPLDIDGSSGLIVGVPFDDDGGSDRGAVWRLAIDDPAAKYGVTPYGCDSIAGSLSVLSGKPVLNSSLVVGINNPLGTQAVGSLPVLVLGLAPDPNFPCGTQIPGWGMASSGSDGELLFSFSPPPLLPYLFGGPWAGPSTPSPISLFIPPSPNIIGLTLYAQGALVDSSPSAAIPIGATSGLAIVIGG